MDDTAIGFATLYHNFLKGEVDYIESMKIVSGNSDFDWISGEDAAKELNKALVVVVVNFCLRSPKYFCGVR